MTSVALLKSHLGGGGGLEKYTNRLIHAFMKRGCDVTVLTTGVVDGPHEGYRVVSLGQKSKLSVMHLRQFDSWTGRWLSKNPHEVVFSMDRATLQTHHRAGNGVHAAYLADRIEEAQGLRRLSLRWNPLHRTILKIERNGFESPKLERLFCNSHMVRKQVLEHYRVDPAKIRVVHNGVEWQEMATDFDGWMERRDQVRIALGLDPQAFQFLFVGNGFRRKGLGYLLEGLSRLAYLPWQLSVVGRDKETSWFEGEVHRLGLTGKVKFFGQRANIGSFYQMADVLTLPSTYDPFANVTVEGLAMGLYVVTSQHNGGAEVLHPQTGTVIESLKDRESVAKTLSIALERPKTPKSALAVRESVKHLEFAGQLDRIVSQCL